MKNFEEYIKKLKKDPKFRLLFWWYGIVLRARLAFNKLFRFFKNIYLLIRYNSKDES